MKILKFNESIEDEPKVGDYVVCKLKWTPLDALPEEDMNYINNHIGVIVKIERHIDLIKSPEYPYHISVGKFQYPFKISREEIRAFSSNEKDLEHLITANKYNL